MVAVEGVVEVGVVGSIGPAKRVVTGGLRDVETGERSLVLVRAVGGGGGGIVLVWRLLTKFSSSSSVLSTGEGGKIRHSW